MKGFVKTSDEYGNHLVYVLDYDCKRAERALYTYGSKLFVKYYGEYVEVVHSGNGHDYIMT